MFVDLQADRKRSRSGRSSSNDHDHDEGGHCEWNGIGDGNQRQYEEQCASMDAAHCGAWATDHQYDNNRCMWVPDSISEAVSSGTNAALGCVWDKTGCGLLCDEMKMATRCATLSHDQNVCESQIGRDYRCVWNHGEREQSMMDAVGSSLVDAMSEQISSADILLGLSLFVSMAFAVYQCYQWRCGHPDGYRKLPGVVGPGVSGLV